jgi:pantoate--beta-alanine ligase
MILFKRIADLQKWLDIQKENNRSVGLVPTMGALHQGHLSLINASREKADVTICSIYVNPTQFNDPRDFEKYPITIESDIEQLEGAGADVLFLPSTDEMYPGGLHSDEIYDLGYLEEILEGKFRPGHFQGVCKIVHRLLAIVKPGILLLGQKDYQQCMVIKKLLEITGLTSTIEVLISPTLREPDGLAMSSRNMRLDNASRIKAAKIYEALTYIKSNINGQIPMHDLEKNAAGMLESNGFNTDYFTIADAETLLPVSAHTNKMVALVAAYLGEVRLIDNLLLT